MFEEFPSLKDIESVNWKRVVENGETLIYEKRSPSPDGSTRWYWTKLEKLGDGFISLWEDITKKKLTEEKIKEQAAFIQNVSGTLPDCVLVMECASLKMLYINREYLEMLGYSQDEIKSMPPEERTRRTAQPEDHPKLMDFYSRLSQAKNNEVVELEQYLAIGQDITEKREAELKVIESKNLLEAAFNSVPNKIALFKSFRDQNGQIEDFEYALVNYANNRNGDVVGKRLSSTHTRIKELGILQKMIHVVETGNATEWQQMYADETHNGWYYLKAVKLNDGCVMTSISLASLLPTEPNAQDILRATTKGGSPAN